MNETAPSLRWTPLSYGTSHNELIVHQLLKNENGGAFHGAFQPKPNPSWKIPRGVLVETRERRDDLRTDTEAGQAFLADFRGWYTSLPVQT
jgi:hypothetical protein